MAGDCYRDAAEYILSRDREDYILVHGYPMHTHRNQKMGHAWVERGDMVYDASSEMSVPRVLYYYIGRIVPEECARYSKVEACENMLKHNHYGPWEERVPNALFKEDE